MGVEGRENPMTEFLSQKRGNFTFGLVNVGRTLRILLSFFISNWNDLTRDV